MKKLFLLLLFSVLSFTSNAQSDGQKDAYISIGGSADIKNGLVGSAPTNNKPEFNGNFKFSMVSNNIDVGIGYETFPRLDFGRFYVAVGYHIKTRYVTFIPCIEGSDILRYDDWGGGLTYQQKSSFLTISANLDVQRKINDWLSVAYSLGVLPRVDLKMMYGDNKTVFSNGIKVVIILKDYNNWTAKTY